MGKVGSLYRDEQGVVLEHPSPEVLAGSQLDFNMYENELGAAVAGIELGDDVGFAGSALETVGEELRVEELDVLEVEPILDVGKEQPQEIPQECVQELLEALVVSHFPSFTDK